MKKSFALVALTAAIASTGAFAQNVGGLYGEVAYSEVKVKDTSATDNVGSFTPTAARMTLGKVVADNVAVEGFVVQGMSSDAHLVSNVTVDIKLKTSYGLAIRPFVKLNDDLEVFARLGTARMKGKVTASNGNVSLSEDAATTHTLYGIGVAYTLNKEWKAVVDYTKLSEKSDMKGTVVAVGVRYSF